MEYTNNDEYLDPIFKYNIFREDRVLRIRVQKENKVLHKCEYRQGDIPIGKGSAYLSGLMRGAFYSYHICETCYEEESMICG